MDEEFEPGTWGSALKLLPKWAFVPASVLLVLVMLASALILAFMAIGFPIALVSIVSLSTTEFLHEHGHKSQTLVMLSLFLAAGAAFAWWGVISNIKEFRRAWKKQKNS